MKTIIRTFLSVLRRFKMATLLNVLGLSGAFAAFMIIMMQVNYDQSFDASHKNADSIFRVELSYDGGKQAIIARPFAELLIASSPHIKEGAIMNMSYKADISVLRNEQKHYFFYDKVLNDLYREEDRLSQQITLFSLIAVFISIVGVFGLVVFECEYRRKEIGLRKVMGSTAGRILAMLNMVYLRILLICFILSVPLVWYFVNNWLGSFAYKTPIHWWVFAIAFIIVAMITVATVSFQSWRAANENPVNSIKTE